MPAATESRERTGQHPSLERARSVSQALDNSIELPVVNYRIGLDPILGILPVAGDSVSLVLSLYVVFEAIRVGASARLVALMLALLAIDFVVGSIPVFGTLFDAVWKANVWNVRLLERHLDS
ncbi:DUF4112 domain-containing protein [Halorientalis brevis]|uniref:DUF4112 domain-containing protein n=1 Tax=Halorientalis brevis TaxID=1126241 RepID=A0ABD6CGL2_9EURY|nr:DUF4112 domain-containing protein [Halorientalis brevis]